MNENDVWEFWGSDPCRDHIVGGLRGAYGDNYDGFVATSDPWRHRQEVRILDSNTRYIHGPGPPRPLAPRETLARMAPGARARGPAPARRQGGAP